MLYNELSIRRLLVIITVLVSYLLVIMKTFGEQYHIQISSIDIIHYYSHTCLTQGISQQLDYVWMVEAPISIVMIIIISIT